MICPTCQRDMKPHQMGFYGLDERPFCLRGPDERGGSCYRNRHTAPTPRTIPALPAKSGAFTEATHAH